MHANYGWIIDKDLHNGTDRGTACMSGLTGPSNIDPELERQLKAGDGKKFRLLDDDGEIYYEGRYLGPDDESQFGPLDDFGLPDSGCTEIQYRTQDGWWETL